MLAFRAEGVRYAERHGALGLDQGIEWLSYEERPIREVMAVLKTSQQGAPDFLLAGHREFFYGLWGAGREAVGVVVPLETWGQRQPFVRLIAKVSRDAGPVHPGS